MKQGLWAVGSTAFVAATWAASVAALGQNSPAGFGGEPTGESVYAPPTPPRPDEGVNEGAVNIDIKVNYMTDYVYRGIEIFDPGSEDSPNLQFDGRINFDLGKLPHPFIGIFANVNDSDPVSRFEEVRPFFGADWTIKPFTFTGGHNTYIYPDRSDMDTGEVFGQIRFDDSVLWRTERPLFNPYVYAAYDYDRYDGWYIEAGVSHDFLLRDWGVTLTTYAHVAYTQGHNQFAAVSGSDGTGFQHYQIGLIGRYSLNTLFNFPRRYGEWSLMGYLNYTDGIDNELRSTNQIWGGAGVGFNY